MFDWERILMCGPVGQWAKLLWYHLFSCKKIATYLEKILICGSVGQTLKRSFFGNIRIPSLVMCGPVGQTYLKPTYLPDTKLVSSRSCMPNVWIGENINVWAVGQTLWVPTIFFQKCYLSRGDIDVWASGPNSSESNIFPQKRLPYIYSIPGGLSKRMLCMKFCLVSKMLEYLTLSMWASGSLGQVALSSVKNYGLFLEDNEVTVIIATFPHSHVSK